MDLKNGTPLAIPNHVAIIMDGNGRWSKARMLPVKMGHRQGAETLRKITDYAIDVGVKYLTAFAFSTENWKRDEREVDGIMDLMNSYLDTYTKDAEKKNTKVTIIGDRTRLSPMLQEKIANIMDVTRAKTGLHLFIAINYGGRDEILRAVKKAMDNAINSARLGDTTSDTIDEAGFAALLDTKDAPDPDLLIRTSGEMRISNFLLWQMAYTEMYFTPKLWPDFAPSDFDDAIKAYSTAQRRFGGR